VASLFPLLRQECDKINACYAGKQVPELKNIFAMEVRLPVVLHELKDTADTAQSVERQMKRLGKSKLPSEL
jgi:hypothetical protein